MSKQDAKHETGFVYVYVVRSVAVWWDGQPAEWHDDKVMVKVGRTKNPLDRMQTQWAGFGHDRHELELGIPRRKSNTKDARPQWDRLLDELRVPEPPYAANFPDLVAVFRVDETLSRQAAEVWPTLARRYAVHAVTSCAITLRRRSCQVRSACGSRVLSNARALTPI